MKNCLFTYLPHSCSNQLKSCECSHCYINCFFLNGPTPASFCLFSFLSTTILQKNCRPQRDSNSDRRSRRWARWPLDHHHGPNLFVYEAFFMFYSFWPMRWWSIFILNLFSETRNQSQGSARPNVQCLSVITIQGFFYC